MLTPEQSRAYEKLSVEGVYENGYSGASVRSTSVDSSRFNESGHLQEVELQTSDLRELPEEIRSGLQRES